MKSCVDQIANSMVAYLADPKNDYTGRLKTASEEVSEAPLESDVEMGTEMVDPSDLPETQLDIAQKEASKMDDNRLIKSAYDKLMQASSELDDAGFEVLAANALVLVNHLIVEAKAKKNKMTDKEKEAFDKMKEKQKLKQLKDKEKAEKDKNDARDKKMKDKEKANAELAKEREAQKKKLEKMQAKKNKE